MITVSTESAPTPLPDPVSASVLKSAIGLLPKLVGAVKREAARRGAGVAETDLSDLSRPMDEALDVIVQPPGGVDLGAWNAVKGFISGRPPIFDDPDIRSWLGRAEVRSDIKAAVSGSVIGDDIQAHLNAILSTFPVAQGRDRSDAAPALNYAVAFVILSIGRDLTVGDRVNLGATLKTQEMLADLGERLGSPPPPPIPLDLVDRHVEETIDTLRKRRFLVPGGILGEVRSLSARLVPGGDLLSATPAVRARALAWCARWLSPHPEEAEPLIAASEAAMTTPEAGIARAFLAANAGWVEGLTALQPIDSAAKRSAALFVHRLNHAPDATVDWLSQAGIAWKDLDPEGRYALLERQLTAWRWEAASDSVAQITPTDLEAAPALNAVAGLTLLACSAPLELRPAMLFGMTPLNPAEFPLDDTPQALEDRRRSERYLRDAAQWAVWAEAPTAARHLEAVALWLRLRDPSTSTAAREDLRQALDDPQRAVSILPLALDFAVPINLDEVERALGAAEALNPKGDADLALARLALAHAQPDVSAQLAYLERHRTLLFDHLAFPGLTDFEIRILAHLGRTDRAREILEAAGDRLEPAASARLAEIIDAGPGGRTLDILEQDYAANPDLAGLARLIEAMIPGGFSERLFDLWRQMIRITRTQGDAEGLVRFLVHHERWAELDALLPDLVDLIPGSLELRGAEAWSLYRKGAFEPARQKLAALRSERDDPNDRALHVNLLVASGRWSELTGYVEGEWQARSNRSAEDLLRLADLAGRIGLKARLGDLLAEAADRAPGDPHVLLNCYSLAVRGGLEDVSRAHQWLEGAVALSDEDGPVQSADLQTLVDEAPAWQARVDGLWTQLRRGELPMALAAVGLRRSPLELQLAPMVANLDEPDPRRRSIVPAFSGVRERRPWTEGALGLDLTAIVTLGHLGVLDRVIAHEQVVIAHGALRYLFEDRQKLVFHQPSRIQFAHTLVRWKSAGKLHAFATSIEADPQLLAQVGQGLAEMLADAGTPRPESEPRRYVIRSNPVQKIGTFSGESADLAGHLTVLRSCGAVVSRLEADGLLSSSEVSLAKAYLDHQKESPWSEDETIADGADLLLDDLSVDYLHTIGVLDRLASAGFRVFISSREIEEANAFLALEALSEKIEAVIEEIRSSVSVGIETGRVIVCPEPGEIDVPRVSELFTSVALVADALVCDDRFVNRHGVITTPDGETPLYTSLDLFDRLQARGILTETERVRHRMVLRRGGLSLFPLEPDEIRTAVAAAATRDGRLAETADLRAIRENVALTAMRGWLKLPEESAWLSNLSTVLLDAIPDQWTPGVDDVLARARSDWLLETSDLRNWAASADGGAEFLARHGFAWQVLKLTLLQRPRPDADTERRYMAWLQQVYERLKADEPAAYEWLVASLRAFVVNFHTGGDDLVL